MIEIINWGDIRVNTKPHQSTPSYLDPSRHDEEHKQYNINIVTRNITKYKHICRKVHLQKHNTDTHQKLLKMTDKCEYEPVDTGDGKKKVSQTL